jgi:hypothetical protein
MPRFLSLILRLAMKHKRLVVTYSEVTRSFCFAWGFGNQIQFSEPELRHNPTTAEQFMSVPLERAAGIEYEYPPRQI